MAFSFEDSIYDFLQKGGNIEDYLTQVQNAANSAQARVQEEKNKKVAADAKVQAANALAEAFSTFMKTFYPDVKWKADLTGPDLIQILDAVLPFASFFKGGFNITMPNSARPAAGDPIEAFLDKYVR